MAVMDLLAGTAYSGQQDDEPDDPPRADNLLEPVVGDPGAVRGDASACAPG